MKSINIVGRNIRRLRIAKGLTIHDLASALPPSAILSAGELAEIEVRTEKIYDYEIQAIAKVLKVPIDALFGTPQKKVKNSRK